MTEERDRRLFTWPPEPSDDIVRDTIMIAGKQLAEGNWKSSLAAILGLRVWSLLPACDVDRYVPV